MAAHPAGELVGAGLSGRQAGMAQLVPIRHARLPGRWVQRVIWMAWAGSPHLRGVLRLSSGASATPADRDGRDAGTYRIVPVVTATPRHLGKVYKDESGADIETLTAKSGIRINTCTIYGLP